MTDSKSNSYTLAVTAVDSFTSRKVDLYYAKNITGGSGHTITCTFDFAGNGAVAAMEASGVDLSAPLDQTATASNVADFNNASSGNTSTTSTANEFLAGSCLARTEGNLTSVNSPFTAGPGDNTQGPAFALGWRVVSATGAYAFTCTINNDFWGAAIATFKAAGAPASNTTKKKAS
jgi:hypothetical protein